MDIFERYLSRNIVDTSLEFSRPPELIVVIPVLNDGDIFATIDSLYRCVWPEGNVGVVVVVNHGEQADGYIKAANERLADELEDYVHQVSSAREAIEVSIIRAFDLPAKFAGVGLARKWGMDAAAAYFYRNDKSNNPIVSLDADTWVEKNYADELIRYFRQHPVAGVSIAYEHRLEECEGPVLDAMIKYELYLRYYEQALRFAGHPYAFHCIGSAFAVRASDYVAQGGMNKRQAGEDFYFLQKLIATGRFATLTTTKVYPSARFSDRTPFGTGQAVKKIVDHQGDYPTYCFAAFELLKSFFQGMSGLYKVGEEVIRLYFDRQPSIIKDFLYANEYVAVVEEVNGNCASEKQFIRRFLDHFNAFRVLKFLNFAHEYTFVRNDVVTETRHLFQACGWPLPDSAREMLNFLRSGKA